MPVDGGNETTEDQIQQAVVRGAFGCGVFNSPLSNTGCQIFQ